MTNKLAKLIDGVPMFQATKTARDFDIQTKEEAEEVLHVYTQAEEKDLQDIVDTRKQAIQTYKGVLRIQKERGNDTKSLETSLDMWERDLKQIAKAYNIIHSN